MSLWCFSASRCKCLPIPFFTGWRLVLTLTAFQFSLATFQITLVALRATRACSALSLFVPLLSYWLKVLHFTVFSGAAVGVVVGVTGLRLVAHVPCSNGKRRHPLMFTWWNSQNRYTTLHRTKFSRGGVGSVGLSEVGYAISMKSHEKVHSIKETLI